MIELNGKRSLEYPVETKQEILLTGSNGFLGGVFKNRLAHHKLITLDFDRSDINCDLSKGQPLISQKIDIVIHCAGKAHVIPRNAEEEQAFYDVNLKGTQNLCDALESSTIVPQTFVFISTVSVYGLEFGKNISEDYPLNGDTPYALSKIQAEQYVIDWSKRNGVNYLIFRLPLLVGQSPPGNLGKMIQAIRLGKYFHLQEGLAKKSMLDPNDLPELILKNKSKSGIFNITDGYHPSFKEIEVIISNKLNCKPARTIPLLLAKILARFGDVVPIFPFNSGTLKKMTLDLTFNDDKAKSELHWSPSKVLDTFKQLNY